MEDLIKSLEILGFTGYESKVFCILFEGTSMTASEVAKQAKIPRASAYNILKSFTQKGICNEIQTSTVALYEIIDPQIVRDKIEKEIRDNFSNKLEKLTYSFTKLQPVYKSKIPAGVKNDVELIKGFNKHREAKFEALIKNAEKEVLLMTKLQGYVSSELDEASFEFQKKGGSVKAIYEVNYDFKIKIDGKWEKVTPEGLVNVCRDMEGENEEIKLTEKIYQNMLIVDRKHAYISLVDPEIEKYNRSDVIIQNENFANAMVEYFHLCWGNAQGLDDFESKLKEGGI